MVFAFLKKLFPQPLVTYDNPDPDKYHVFTDKFDKEIDADAIDLHIGTTDWSEWNKARNTYKTTTENWKLNAIRQWEAGISKLQANPQFDGQRIAVSILIDHSGSMKGDKAFLGCALAEVLADGLFKLGVQYEILGFTTSTWLGGRSRQEWKRSGFAKNPGRLCDLLHIIYRPFSGHHAGAGKDIHNIFRDELLKENVDGEALLWAANRFPETGLDKRILVVVSDGAPVDDSTLSYNPDRILQNHLKDVITKLTAQDISIAGIGLGYDTSRYYSNCIILNSSDQLGTEVSELLVPLLTP